MATPEFSKFVDILSATLSQHHLLGFELVSYGMKTEKEKGGGERGVKEEEEEEGKEAGREERD